jgi:nucleoid-associated protein Lsr2
MSLGDTVSAHVHTERPVRNHRRGQPVKVTIDSSEPLDDAIRVLGALYDVTLVVSPSVADPSREAQERVAVRVVRAGARPPRRGAAKERAVRTPKGRGGRARKNAAPVETAELRSWARDNGYAVSDRGRVATSVVQAYDAAHQG